MRHPSKTGNLSLGGEGLFTVDILTYRKHTGVTRNTNHGFNQGIQ